MGEDIKILEEYLLTLEKMGGMEMLKRGDILIRYVKYKEIQAIENLIKEFKKIKIENIKYKLGQTPDTTEDYKTLKKELEKWKKI